MKIHIPNHSKQSIGGGWTFLNTFIKYGSRTDAQFTDYDEAQVVFISGATMVDREFILKAKKAGKKIVLRVDNIPRNSRNRNTGTSRLYDFAQVADLIVFQSYWAKFYIGPFIQRQGPVIINGADHEIFKPDGTARPKDGKRQYLFAQFNRDETKQWHQAWYKFIMENRTHEDAHLWLVGNFSPEHREYNFDFFQGEKFDYLGVIDDPRDMAEVMRGTDMLLLPYFNDACSNTLIEFLLCHEKDAHLKVWQNGTGGNKDILEAYAGEPEKLKADYMAQRYIEEIAKIL